jgi:RNA polymerase sigma-70 factor (ECF subfamily)
MSQHLEEKAWVEAARAGDRDAFWKLVELFGPMVHRILLRTLRDRDRAHDTFSETFLRAWERIGDFRGDSKFSTWLVTIALNRARNELRRGGRQRNIRWEDVIPSEAHRHGDGAPSLAEWSNPVEALEQKELRTLLDRALDDLPPKYRVVFTLRDIEGLSTQETAQVLGLSQTAVKSRAVRARLAMRKFLAPYFAPSRKVTSHA